MKLNSKISNTVILLLGIVATLVLTQLGCQNATKSGVKNHEIEETHARPSEGEKPPFVQDATIEEGADLDQVVENAVQNIAKGRETGDMMLVMNEGIMKLRAVLDKNPEHEKALYTMGMMSIESGQLEKGLKRFEKLVLLHPENQEYQKMLAEIQDKLK